MMEETKTNTHTQEISCVILNNVTHTHTQTILLYIMYTKLLYIEM